MNKTFALAACLLAGAAGAQPAAERSLSLWIEPLSGLTLTPWYASQDDTFIMIPVGAHVPLGPTQDLVLELTPLWTRQDCEGRCTTEALAMAVGTSWTVAPNSRGGGLFLQPKLVGVLSRDFRPDSPPPQGPGSFTAVAGQLSLGLDMGYRVTRETLFLEFVLGFSVGRGWNVPQSSQSVFFSFLDWPERAREDKWVWDLNVHLVRLGLSF